MKPGAAVRFLKEHGKQARIAEDGETVLVMERQNGIPEWGTISADIRELTDYVRVD